MMRIVCLGAALIGCLTVADACAAPVQRGSDIHYTRGETIELARSSNISSVNCNPTQPPDFQLSGVVSGKLRVQPEVRILKDGEGPFHDANVGFCEGKEVTEYVLYYDPAPGFLGNVPVNYVVTFADGSSLQVNDVVVVEKAPEPAVRCPKPEELRAREQKIEAKSRKTKAIFTQCHNGEI
jgi:hypothetical protein